MRSWLMARTHHSTMRRCSSATVRYTPPGEEKAWLEDGHVTVTWHTEIYGMGGEMDDTAMVSFPDCWQKMRCAASKRWKFISPAGRPRLHGPTMKSYWWYTVRKGASPHETPTYVNASRGISRSTCRPSFGRCFPRLCIRTQRQQKTIQQECAPRPVGSAARRVKSYLYFRLISAWRLLTCNFS